MHPIGKALEHLGWTQQQLADKVNALKIRRASGKLVRLTQGYISSVLDPDSGKHVSVPLAKAIAEAVGNFVSASEIALFEWPNDKRRSKRSAA